MTSDGKPYAPSRYKDIVKERYLISKFIHTSYADLNDVTPLEREYILQFIYEEKQKEKEAQDKASQSMKHKFKK